ncbi:MAG: hypothetical protein ACK56I_01540, partial [bacterium]
MHLRGISVPSASADRKSEGWKMPPSMWTGGTTRLGLVGGLTWVDPSGHSFPCWPRESPESSTLPFTLGLVLASA